MFRSMCRFTVIRARMPISRKPSDRPPRVAGAQPVKAGIRSLNQPRITADSKDLKSAESAESAAEPVLLNRPRRLTQTLVGHRPVFQGFDRKYPAGVKAS